MMSSDLEVVDINGFDILLTDVKGETIRNLEVDGAPGTYRKCNILTITHPLL
jgi:hypothetical protein